MGTFLDKLLELDKAATPAPWGVGQDAIYHSNGLHDEADGYAERWLASPMADGDENPRSETWDEDTALIVALRNAAARLAVVVEAAGLLPSEPYDPESVPYVYVRTADLAALRAALTALDTEPT
jgi:hypothetical protein